MLESLFQYRCSLKETLGQLFSCKIAKFLRNFFFCRTPPVAASGKIRTKPLRLAKFQFHLFLTALDIVGPLYKATVT